MVTTTDDPSGLAVERDRAAGAHVEHHDADGVLGRRRLAVGHPFLRAPAAAALPARPGTDSSRTTEGARLLRFGPIPGRSRQIEKNSC